MDEPFGLGIWQNKSEDVLSSEFPLHKACRDGDTEALSMLLVEAEQHNLHREDSFYGWTPLHWAAYFGKLNCVMKLLEWGVHCDLATEKLRQGPAHIAAFAGHSRCLKWLLNCGANMNSQDYLGETPAHKAARTGSLECVSLLASHGARLLVKNNCGLTPAQVAYSCGHSDCAQYIETASTKQQTLPEQNISWSSYGFHLNLPHPQDLTASEDPVNGHKNGCSNGVDDQHSMEDESQGDPITAKVIPHKPLRDITLDKAVSRNLVSVAGRKRTRDDEEEYGYKRRKSQGENPYEMQTQHMELELTAHKVEDFQGSDADVSNNQPTFSEDSMDKMNQNMEPDRNQNLMGDLEPVRQGYDSMCYEALTGLFNGS